MVVDSSLKDKIIARGVHSIEETIDPDSDSGPRSVTTSCYNVLDLNCGEVSSSSSCIPHTLQGTGLLCFPLAVGSRVFIFGKPMVGDDEEGKGKGKGKRKCKCFTYSFELTKPEQGWKRCASSLTLAPSQMDPKGVEFGGKMYFFGESACEVFDPESNQWSRIKSPPRSQTYNELTAPVMADHKNNRIIVWFQNISALYAYYPNEDRWVCVAEGFRGWCTRLDSDQVTLADGVIYFHNQHCRINFRAFDIATRQWLKVQVPPGYSTPRYNRFQSLLHRGNGLLCLLGYAFKDCDPMANNSSSSTVVRAVQFKVKIIINDAAADKEKEVHVTPLSSKDFCLDCRCPIFHYLLV